MKPLVSIIVPVYNVSNYIEQCLNSLTNQTLKEIEIIVVDDCGTDDSIDKAEKLAKKDKRIKIVHNKTNQGLAESRNIGLKYVKTEYVAFLDSDDWVAEDFIEKLYNACIIENADIAVSDVIYYYNQNKQTREWVSTWNFKSGKKINSEPEDKQYNMYACACWNKLYRTELFVKYNLKFPKGLYIEDVPITFITTMLANKIVMVEDTRLYYRMRNDSIMATSKTDRKPFDIFKIYEYTEALFNEYKEFDKHKQYRQILDNFEIFNIYGWHARTGYPLKDEFWQKMRKVFKNINIEHNSFITPESRDFYNIVLYGDKSIKIFYIRFFDVLPLLKYKKSDHFSKVWLLDFIPFISYKNKENKKCFYMFGIPLFQQTTKRNKTKYSLFKILPFLSIKRK